MTDQASSSPEHLLDARGLFCPEPVMLLHKKIREIAAGDILSVIATDPSTQRDIPKFCHFLGHELLQASEDSNLYRYRIRKCKA
ncbi:MAG: sulfurtransferase TusA [Pseudomonadales bacterium]|nr:sulfurtransferase TusA [Pseudomonadales bacterium]